MNKLAMFAILFSVMLLITVSILEVAGLFIYRNHYNWNHRYQFGTRDSWRVIEDGFASPGDRIVITAGFPFGTPGSTNILRIARVEGPDGRMR